MPALPLSPEQLADAARLKAIYMAKKRELGLTQESLASACGWESQGSVSQYLNGKIPLNVEAAVKFAKALRVSVSDFSPRLAADLAELTDEHVTAGSPPRPPAPSPATGEPNEPARLPAETRALLENLKTRTDDLPPAVKKATADLIAIYLVSPQGDAIELAAIEALINSASPKK